ncbi:G-protein coupled receptor Mth2-like [Achroia grisella]|uniref:G-protein coupled receptor Mth2-like n=1 Tax=Achroia grisella TaxID=688607 RepID=UPI0027D2C2CF|nr:G-protein coupled receptor Mth2-like [Achroia grisella]
MTMVGLTLLIVPLLVVSVVCNPCSERESIDITNGELLHNSSIIHNGIEYKIGTWYQPEESIRLGCPCIGRICIWKCCGPSEMYQNKECAKSDLEVVNPFNPTVYKGRDPVQVDAHLHFFYMYNTLCDDKYLVDTNINYQELFLQENGTLVEVVQGRPQWLYSKEYCVDMMMDNSTDNLRLMAAVCYPDETTIDDSSALYIAYAVGLMLSVPFLLVTFIVYAFIPELRNLHGLCLMAYCAGLIVAYIFLAYLKVQSGQMNIAMTGCVVSAFIVYYAFQSSFFWLNVMCFDIWRTFSGYRGSSTSKRRETRRFTMYSFYAWGIPLLLTAVTASMQYANLPPGVIKPGFGDKRCWFDNWLSELLYFFAPVLVLVVCNTVFFSVTAHRIRSIKQETSILKGSKSTSKDKMKNDKQRYSLYLKLFMVMGINWSVELISFMVGGSNWYWVVIDISNIMLGFFIFMIFVWKKKVRNLIVRRYRSIRGLPYIPTDSRKSANMTSTAVTEESRLSSEDPGIRLKDLH